MKKAVFSLAVVLAVMMLLTSCVSTKYKINDAGKVSFTTGLLALGSSTYKLTVDENVPLEQTAVVTFTDGTVTTVKEWNGKDIKEDLYKKKTVSNKDKAVLTVPAGNNSFTFDIVFVYGSSNSISTYPFKDLELRYDLEPGKKYQIIGTSKSLGFFKGDELYVGIYDEASKKIPLKEWKLGET